MRINIGLLTRCNKLSLEASDGAILVTLQLVNPLAIDNVSILFQGY